MIRSPAERFHAGHVLGTAAALYVPLAILLAKGIAPLFAAAGLGVLLLGFVRERRVRIPAPAVSAALATFAAWALVSWLWSITPDETVKTGISFAATLFGGAVLVAAGARLDESETTFFRNALMFGGAAGFMLIAFEFASDAWLTRHLYGLAGKLLFNVQGRYTAAMSPGLAATALFFWPWAKAVRARFPGVGSGLAITAGFGLVLLSQADAVGVGMIAGAAVFGATLAWPRRLPWLLAIVITVGIATAPLIVRQLPDPLTTESNVWWLPNSALHRFIIWKTADTHIKRHPVLGGGFDTSRALYGPEDRVRYAFRSGRTHVPWSSNFEPIPLHPHNAVLQVWLELGGVGALIFLALLLSVVRAIHVGVPDRTDRAVALAQLTTGATIACLSFGAWQSWWLTSILLAAALAAAMLGRAPGAPKAAAAPSTDRGIPPPGETPVKTPGETPSEIGGPKGLEPTRYGDWERKGRAIDF